MHWRIGAILGMVVLALAVGAAQAQTGYPSRPVTMVLPLPAGGTADLLCRFAADKASGILGQQVVLENRPGGAGGRVGTEQVMRSPPDGYTLLCAPQLTFSITHLVFTKAAFDTRGLEPISVLATYPLILIGRAGAPFNTTAELRHLCTGQSGQGQRQPGQGKHRASARRAVDAQGQFPHDRDPYRGSAPAINDLLAGNIDMVPDYLLANKANIDAGKLKFLATASRTRLKDYPNVATIAEALPGVYADTWMAVAAPAGTPKEITRKVSDAIRQGFQQADLKARTRARSRAARQHARADERHDPDKVWRPGGRWSRRRRSASTDRLN